MSKKASCREEALSYRPLKERVGLSIRASHIASPIGLSQKRGPLTEGMGQIWSAASHITR